MPGIEYELAPVNGLGLTDERHLPENHRFKIDSGCFVAVRCAGCPLPDCLVNLPLPVRMLAIALAGAPAERLLKDSMK